MDVFAFDLQDEKEISEWDQFVENHPEATPFHHSKWLRCLQNSYQFNSHHLVVKDADRIIGLIPLFELHDILKKSRLVSLPFSDYGGLLGYENSGKLYLTEKLKEIYENRSKRIEIRGNLAANSGFRSHDYYKRHLLALSKDPATVFKQVNKRTIQFNIRKARKKGIVVQENNSRKGFEEFYRLHFLTRKRHGIPIQPLKFFQNFYSQLILKNMANIVLATYAGKAIAAGIFLKFKDTVYYKYNASDPQYISAFTPNHLLTWYAIEKACLEGYHTFDFGRTSPDNPGLMRHKEMWGATSIDLPYYYYPKIKGNASIEEKSIIYRCMTTLWRNLPDPLVKAIGPHIYKYLG